MDAAGQQPDACEQFTDILERMRLLGDDFTAHADDHEVIRALADVPQEDPGPAGDVLPDDYCVQLDLPPGTPYRIAARKLADVLGPEHGHGAR
jgi:hypothetical protein